MEVNGTRATITVPEAAARLGISRATAFSAARTGELPTLRFGRRLVVPVKALEHLLEAKKAVSP